MTQPILCDPNSNPLPIDYDPNRIEKCDDCKEDFRAAEITDTIAGYFCPECTDRFMSACRGLVDACTHYTQRKAGTQ